MAKNTDKGYRHGEIKKRSQVQNPISKEWIKRDRKTGQFMAGKKSKTPFKGVREE
jgi:transposase